jgi:putative transposase
VVVPDVPHHLTQRGNRRQETFFCRQDYESYRELMAHWCTRCGVAVWAYCLMPNHVHLIAVPGSGDGLRRAVGEPHRRYTRRVNFRQGWRGHLWQGRFASFPMDERYLMAAARYVELNPVRARLVERPQAYAWSSARAHLTGRDDGLVKVGPLLDIVGDWKEFLSEEVGKAEADALRRSERTGRPLGSESFMVWLEGLVGRRLRRRKPGPGPAAHRVKYGVP